MTDTMHEAYLSLGSNTPDRASRMESAIAFVSTIGLDMLVSEIYQTAAVNGRDPDYLNAVVRIHTPLCREEVEALVKSWEKKIRQTSGTQMRRLYMYRYRSCDVGWRSHASHRLLPHVFQSRL